MDAIILAGGFGTRLRELVSDVPKPMAKIDGTPFLEILLGQLASKGLTKVIISIGYLGDVIQNHFGSEYKGLSLHYSIEANPLGTGGAIKKALHLVETSSVLVMNGDSYVEFDLDEISNLHNQRGEPVCLVREVDDTSRFGRIENLNGYISQFGEKNNGGPGLINGGVYLLPKTIFNDAELPESFSFENDFLQEEVLKKPFIASVAQGIFIDIGVPEDFTRAQELLRDI